MGLNGVFDGSGGTAVAGLLMIVEKWKRIVGQQLRYFWFFFFVVGVATVEVVVAVVLVFIEAVGYYRCLWVVVIDGGSGLQWVMVAVGCDRC